MNESKLSVRTSDDRDNQDICQENRPMLALLVNHESSPCTLPDHSSRLSTTTVNSLADPLCSTSPVILISSPGQTVRRICSMSSQHSKANTAQTKSFLEALNRRRSSRQSTDSNLDVPPISLCESIREMDSGRSVDSHIGPEFCETGLEVSELSSSCSTRSQNTELAEAAHDVKIADMMHMKDPVAHTQSATEQLTSVNVKSLAEDLSSSMPSEFEFDDDARQFSTSFSVDGNETGLYDNAIFGSVSTDLYSDLDQQNIPGRPITNIDADMIAMSRTCEHIAGVDTAGTNADYNGVCSSPFAYTTEQLYDPSFDKDDSLVDDCCPVEFCLEDDDQPMTMDEFKSSSYGQQLYQESASLRLAWDLMLDSDVRSTLVEPSSSCSQDSAQTASTANTTGAAFREVEHNKLSSSSKRLQPLNDRCAMGLTASEVESAFMRLATIRLTKVLLSGDNIDEMTSNFTAVSRAIEGLCCELSLGDDEMTSEAYQVSLLTDELANLKDKQGQCKSDFYMWQADEFSDSKLREIQIEHLYNQILQTESLYEAALLDRRKSEEKVRLSDLAKKTLASSTAIDSIVHQLQVEEVSFWLNSFSDEFANENMHSSITCTGDQQLAEMSPLQPRRPTCDEEELATRNWVQAVRRRDVTKLYESNECKSWNAARLPFLDRIALKPVASILKRRPKFRRQLEDSTYTGPIKSILVKNTQVSASTVIYAPVVTSIPSVNLEDLTDSQIDSESRENYVFSRTDTVSSFQRSSSPSKQGLTQATDPNVGEHLRTMAYERLIRVSDRNPDLQRNSSFQRLPRATNDSSLAGHDCFSQLRNGDDFRTTSFGSVASHNFDGEGHATSLSPPHAPTSGDENYNTNPVAYIDSLHDGDDVTGSNEICETSMAEAMRALQKPFEDLAGTSSVEKATDDLKRGWPECGKENRAFGVRCQVSTLETQSRLSTEQESPFKIVRPDIESTNSSLLNHLVRGPASVRIGKSSAITTEFRSPASGSRKRSPASSPFSHPISQLKSYEMDNKFWELGRNSSVRTTEGISSRWFRSVRGPSPVSAEHSKSQTLKLSRVTSWFKSLSTRRNSRLSSKVNILQMSSVPSGLTQIQDLFCSASSQANVEGDESFNRRWFDKHKHTIASKQ